MTTNKTNLPRISVGGVSVEVKYSDLVVCFYMLFSLNDICDSACGTNFKSTVFAFCLVGGNQHISVCLWVAGNPYLVSSEIRVSHHVLDLLLIKVNCV